MDTPQSVHGDRNKQNTLKYILFKGFSDERYLVSLNTCIFLNNEFPRIIFHIGRGCSVLQCSCSVFIRANIEGNIHVSYMMTYCKIKILKCLPSTDKKTHIKHYLQLN